MKPRNVQNLMTKIILQKATARSHGSEMEPTSSFGYISGKIFSQHSPIKDNTFFFNRSLEMG